MQRKIEIVHKSRNYIIKVDDDLTLEEVVTNCNIIKEKEVTKHSYYLSSKKRFIQPFNKLRDFQIVTNDVIELWENDEKTI